MKKVLLIGGAGYIGPIVAKQLLQENYMITVYDNCIYENAYAVDTLREEPNFEFINGDINNEKDLDKNINRADMVILLAGLVGDPITKKYPKESIQINEIGIQNCIHLVANKKLEKFIFISTCSNYGLITGDYSATENEVLAPISEYAKAKVKAENLILSFGERSMFNPTILRFATAFGVAPRMRFDLTVNQFTRELFLGNELKVFDADTWRPYCHVRDFAQIISLVLSAPNSVTRFEIFNAGSNQNNYTKRQIIQLIQKHVPNSQVIYEEGGMDRRNYKVNFDKLVNSLNFSPKFSVENGILEILDALKLNQFKESSLNSSLYGNYSIDTKSV